MITAKEKKGLEKILSRLSSDDIYSLSYTTTKGMVKVETRQDAERSILMFTDRAVLLLKRRKIKKEIIFSYLMSEGVSVNPDGEKRHFIQACLNYWNSEVIPEDLDSEMLEDNTEIYNTLPSQGQIEEYNSSTVSNNQLLKMAEKFSEWFYTLLNKHQEEVQSSNDCFGPHHFWPQCKLNLSISVLNEVIEEEILGDVSVYQTLRKLVQTEKLLFNPNSGSQENCCFQDSHGPVKLAIGGVVHRNNNCIGLFDSCFGLIQDPHTDDRWRIKFMSLSLRLGERLLSRTSLPAPAYPSVYLTR
ncbi:uncharacterized protein C3orf38 homolog [Limulus polyphemus]|uniref:Uncharacterized protein C3orf38 homolog n=1 Tax=Limulus polyphemus TaxID=6850 RepID=A0ABM1TRJ6_LIMPO|nr:uncharacterized protein C3orf38 homolog [Limulus polyphemus]XP_022258496.1 uncharacterized protein C3orf38 homolog [Limulus polyphemus]XP_022258497.1 uncharacterized protein C3orf38 homolog [Limulus polyphemus]XP_022258498.1 uncharacterized protein C3orf38 homolog [Limulus polyphemus]XP_022258499.1 uncharacterized protein C3orf38 homolog [Limulus polyphemus]XP_022258500.1 uncharacterized protein C3orf38 homolog [Limulus polyphemus]XP_022258501.1 uncharacterized protein C3orf38 homolog [Lim